MRIRHRWRWRYGDVVIRGHCSFHSSCLSQIAFTYCIYLFWLIKSGNTKKCEKFNKNVFCSSLTSSLNSHQKYPKIFQSLTDKVFPHIYNPYSPSMVTSTHIKSTRYSPCKTTTFIEAILRWFLDESDIDPLAFRRPPRLRLFSISSWINNKKRKNVNWNRTMHKWKGYRFKMNDLHI